MTQHLLIKMKFLMNIYVTTYDIDNSTLKDVTVSSSENIKTNIALYLAIPIVAFVFIVFRVVLFKRRL